MLVVHGNYISQPSRSVLWALKIKNVEFKFEDTPLGSEKLSSAEYKKLNPNGLVPTIEDDGFALFEGSAILEYLAEKHNWTDLYPTDAHQRAKVNQMLHWHHSGDRLITSQLLVPVIHEKTNELSDLDKVYLQQKAETLEKVLTRLEVYLASSSYVAGTSSFSIADLLMYPEVHQLEQMNVFNASKYPKTANWLSAMKKLPHHDEIHSQVDGLVEQLGIKNVSL